MSTRANVIIMDGYDQLYFYRHSDGYPEGALPTLKTFLQMVLSEQIRDNASQAAGWLILIGHEEYSDRLNPPSESMRWKVGAYEPTSRIHTDVEFIYEIDLTKKEIRVFTAENGKRKDLLKIVN